jgi:hypothetical protein
MLEANTIIGFIGAMVLLVAFLLNQIGRWQTKDFEYDFINLIGAALLSVYAWQIGSMPLIILFVIWTMFSLKDVLYDGFMNLRKKRKETKEEKEPMMKENAIMSEPGEPKASSIEGSERNESE